MRMCLFVAGLTLAGSTRASGGNATRRISPTCCRRGGSGPTVVCLDWSIHCGCRRLSLYFFQLWVGGLSGWEILRCRGIFAIDVLFLLVVRPGRSLCRCTIVLSFLNEEQMLAAWLSDWAPSLARRYICFHPEELLRGPRTHARSARYNQHEWNMEVRFRLCYSKTPPLPWHKKKRPTADCRIVVATKPKLHNVRLWRAR